MIVWPFTGKKISKGEGKPVPCPYCNSNETVPVSDYRAEKPDYIKTWRGQRYVTRRCLKCGEDFYVAEPPRGPGEVDLPDDRTIEDEDELRRAEEERKRQADDEGDHTFK